MTDPFGVALTALSEKRNLLPEQATRAFQIIMNGGATPAQMGAFLMGLRTKGETPEEIAAGAEVLRVKAAPFSASQECMDSCGTGGAAQKTLNISTAVAIVLAACGVAVAKHGNRAVSSACGSADVLEALGVRIDADTSVMERCLKEINLCFLMAPRYHAAMRHVAPVRQELKMRTVFNLLGPLSNPARPTRQLLGVYAEEWVEPMAQVLLRLSLARAWVVHGLDGVDELSIAGPSRVAEVKDGAVRLFELSPQDAGLKPSPLQLLASGNARHNASALQNLLTGERSAYRDAVLLNVAAGLVIGGHAADLREGAGQAAAAIDEGLGLRVLRQFVALSNESLSSRTK